MSPDGTSSPAEAYSPSHGWAGRFLPAPGFERKSFLALVLIVIALKVLTIIHYRVDSDETQHAHVVWAWTQGQLQYRDLFDNHMPLFQMAFAPIFGLLGEHSYIMVQLRIAMLPLFVLCLWCVFRLAEILYSRRIAPWAALSAAALPAFFFTSTEFRTDDLWAFFWLLSLLVAVRGPFTLKRAFGFALMLGLTFAVSLKTILLVIALGIAALLALTFAWLRREGPAVFGAIGRLLLIVAGAVIPPALVVWYFASRGAYRFMYYCVISHNIVPGLKRWGHFSLHQWDFPVSLLVLAAYGWLIFRQTADTRLAIRRAVILLTPWLFLSLLLSYWPDITREDDLPYTPLVPLSFIPLLTLAGGLVRSPRARAKFLAYGPAAICLAELIWTWNVNPLRTNRMKNSTRSIADVLLLTHPGDYVMDAKGDYVFRPRPFYWVIETLTKTRMRLGMIKESIPAALEKTGTRVCYLDAAHILPEVSLFIASNYIPFDQSALALGVAGKELGAPAADGAFSFEVAIPATYAIVSESGDTAGILDGTPYRGPVPLAAGHHVFRRTSGSGRAAIFLDRAVAAGFHPLFDASEKFITQERSRAE